MSFSSFICNTVSIAKAEFSTFPSIYVNFQGLNAGDYCGTTSISSTMLAFSPGELSTIIGPVGHRFSSSRAFNPGDLPCPPQSIMVSVHAFGANKPLVT